MFFAMNRFTVALENAADFEQMWLSRDSRLHENPGFVEFHMLKGPEKDGHVLYASHAVWESETAFTDWTQSPQFHEAHARAGRNRKLHEGVPQFEGFQTIQHIAPAMA